MKTPLTLSRKQARMPIPTLKQRELREPADRSGLDHGGPRATRSQADARLGRPSADARPHQQLVPEETAPAWAEPVESLVADPRASLTPAQVVDQRLLALLGSGNPGCYIQASGNPGGVRRQTGE